MRRTWVILLVILFALWFYSCGKKAEEAKEEEMVSQQAKEEKAKTEKTPMETMEDVTKQIKEKSEEKLGGKITVSARDALESALPDVPGWEKGKPSYSKTTLGQMSTSEISAEYTREDQRVSVRIVDAAEMSSVLMPFKMGLSMHVEREDDSGYSKTFDFKDHKGIIEHHKGDNRTEMSLLYNDRYIMSFESRYLDEKSLKEFMKKTDFSKLKK